LSGDFLGDRGGVAGGPGDQAICKLFVTGRADNRGTNPAGETRLDAIAARPIAVAVAGEETAVSKSHDDDKITAGTRKDEAVTGPADTGPAVTSDPRRTRRPRGAAARGRVRARRGLILPVVGAGALAAALLSAAPAHAGSGVCNLRYYFNYDGSPDWPSMQVNDPSTTGSVACDRTPAIARYNGGTFIASSIQSIDGAILTYVNPDGATSFTRGDVTGGLFLALGPPAAVPYSGGTEIAFPLVDRLAYMWEPVGAKLQGPEIPASSGISQNAPAMARTGAATEIAATGTDDSLWFYWNIDGTQSWGSQQIAGPWRAYGTPAITADNNSTEVAYIGADASLWFDWVINGTTTWHAEQVSGPGTVNSGLAMTHSYGGIQIAATGPLGSLKFFWAADGTSTWHPQMIAGPGAMQGAPAMVAGNYTMEIAVTATDGSLRYYWSQDGTPTWYESQIAPPGTASSSPAMTRSSGGTEIAVAGP
jgi:hypothetical protein